MDLRKHQEFKSICPVCSIPADKSCSACHMVSYCSSEHQKCHWNTHKNDCSPLTLKENDDLGRYFAANRDLKAGTLVIQESPVSYAPHALHLENTLIANDPVCLTCCSVMTTNPGRRCSKCKWPLCSKICEKNEYHAENECKLFAQRRIKYKAVAGQLDVMHKSIGVLRACLIKTKNPKIWEKLMKLQHETSIYKEFNWAYLQMHALQQMKNLKVTDLFSTEEWTRVYSILNINALKTGLTVGQNYGFGGFLFLKSSMFAHSCVANCSLGISSPPKFELRIRTSVDIKKGEAITIPYGIVFNFAGTNKRQRLMRAEGGFICKCIRCNDPTELGCNASTLFCPYCKIPTLLPVNPLDLTLESVWRCNCCSAIVPGQNVNALANFTYEKIRDAVMNEESVVALEEIIASGSANQFHRNHWTMIEASRKIIKYMGNTSRPVFSEEERDLYLILCKVLLGVADVTSPGISKERAQLQQLIASESLRKAEKLKEDRKLSPMQFKEEVKQVYEIQKRAFIYFKEDLTDWADPQSYSSLTLFLIQEMQHVNELLYYQ